MPISLTFKCHDDFLIHTFDFSSYNYDLVCHNFDFSSHKQGLTCHHFYCHDYDLQKNDFCGSYLMWRKCLFI